MAITFFQKNLHGRTIYYMINDMINAFEVSHDEHRDSPFLLAG